MIFFFVIASEVAPEPFVSTARGQLEYLKKKVERLSLVA